MNSLNNARPSILSSKGIWIAAAILLTILAGMFVGIISYAALLLAVAAIVILSDEDALCILMFLMPFATIFKASPNSQSFFTYILIFYVAWSFLKKRKINESFLISFVILLLFLAAQLTVSMNLLRTIKFVVNILFIYFALNTVRTEDNKKIYLSYIMGIAISSLIAALNLIPNLDNYVGTTELGSGYVGIERFTGLYSDPNYYSVNLIICLCLIVILHHKKQLSALPSLILAAAMVAFAIMTFSKSAFLMLFLPLFMLFYSKFKSRKYLIFAVVFTVGIILVLAIFAGKIEAFNTVISRFTASDDISSLTTGRTDIWLNYLKYLANNLLNLAFGVGFGGSLVGALGAHNTYIDLIYYLGITGSIILVALFVSVLRINKPKNKRNLLNFSAVITIAIMYFFISELFYFDWPFHIILAVMAIGTNTKNSDTAQ